METWKIIVGLMVALIVLNLIESQSERAADVYVFILVLGFVAANQASLLSFAGQVQSILGSGKNES